MRHRVIFVAMAIVTVVIALGCSSRDFLHLQQIDSAIEQHPDSAFVALDKIDTEELSCSDRAYYALLLTKAKYKLYHQIENDSLINIAVDYYTCNFDRDKLAQSLMYQGNVYLDLKFKHLALDSYKESEKIADTSDYITCGLLNTRIGELYQKNYVANQEDIYYNKKAAYYFQKAGNKSFEFNSLNRIAQLYILKNYDSSLYYVNKSLDIAQGLEQQRDIEYSKFLKALLYNHYDTMYIEAKNLMLEVIGDECNYFKNQTIYELSSLYIKLGEIDSARYIASLFPKCEDKVDSMRYDMMHEKLAITQGNYRQAHQYLVQATDIADAILNESRAGELYAADKQFDNKIANERAENYRLSNIIRNYVIAVIFLVSIIVGAFFIFIVIQKKRQEERNEIIVSQLQTEIATQYQRTKRMSSDTLIQIDGLNKTLEQKAELEQSLITIVNDRMQTIKELMSIKYQFGQHPDAFLKQFDKIVSFSSKSKALCDGIVFMANQLSGGVIDYTMTKNSDIQLNDSEVLLLSLFCLDFGVIECAVFLSCSSTDSVYKRRSRLAKKLRAQSIESYIEATKMILCK